MKKLSLLSIFFIFQLYASDFFIIDVRTPEEFSNGHVEESINYEWQEIALKIRDIDKNEKIGIAGFTYFDKKKTMLELNCALRPNCQRRGIATKLS